MLSKTTQNARTGVSVDSKVLAPFYAAFDFCVSLIRREHLDSAFAPNHLLLSSSMGMGRSIALDPGGGLPQNLRSRRDTEYIVSRYLLDSMWSSGSKYTGFVGLTYRLLYSGI
jgi:hypothetical protein